MLSDHFVTNSFIAMYSEIKTGLKKIIQNIIHLFFSVKLTDINFSLTTKKGFKLRYQDH